MRKISKSRIVVRMAELVNLVYGSIHSYGTFTLCVSEFKMLGIFSRVHATLHDAMSVRRWSVGRL